MPDENTTNRLFPTGDPDLDKLEMYGDPIERLICQDFLSLQNVLLPYARVWANHIYPRRLQTGAFLVEEWQQFGGCHYSALVRLHHALVAKDVILSLCENVVVQKDDTIRILEVHSACAAFWDNLGAAIDNFAHAREEAKKALGIAVEKRKSKQQCPTCGAEKTREKFAARTLSDTENPKLFYAFERRHQFIHSILVPHQVEDGKIVFNLRHYDDAATKWSQDVIVFCNIDTQIKSDWDEVSFEFGNSWSNLHSWLQVHDTSIPKQEIRAANNSNGVEVYYSGTGSTAASGTVDCPLSGSNETE